MDWDVVYQHETTQQSEALMMIYINVRETYISSNVRNMKQLPHLQVILALDMSYYLYGVKNDLKAPDFA